MKKKLEKKIEKGMKINNKKYEIFICSKNLNI